MIPTLIKREINVKIAAEKTIQHMFNFEKYRFSIFYTFSFTFLPNNPAGLMIKIKIKITYTMASLYKEDP